jgi:hypothetical protein
MGQAPNSAIAGDRFRVAVAAAGSFVVVYLVWLATGLGGHWTTLVVDDLGQLAAPWIATLACALAARRPTPARTSWTLLAISSFLWGLGQAVWCYLALVRGTAVPFPSLADVGFLSAIPFACGALLAYPGGLRRTTDRVHGVLDGCIIAMSLLFASWATVLGPLYRNHGYGLVAQVISLAYPMSDVVLVSLVVILLARSGVRGRGSLGLVMTGIVAFAVSDTAFAYLTEVHQYSGGSVLDAGWVAGYLLIGLGAWQALVSPVEAPGVCETSTISRVAPYLPVLVVLAATSVQLLRGRPIGAVSWYLAFALVVLVLGREALRLGDLARSPAHRGTGPHGRRSDDPPSSAGQEASLAGDAR